MMWRILVTTLPLMWLCIISVTLGNSNETVVEPEQGAEQPVTSTPGPATSTATQNGTNNYITVTATGATLATDALSPAAKANTDAKDSPQKSMGETTSLPPPTTPQTLLSTSVNRTATLIENPATYSNYSNSNYSNLSATPEKLQERTTSDFDYLLNVTTTESTQRPQTTRQHVLTNPPLEPRPAQDLLEYPPSIEVGPRNKTVEVGDEVTMRCKVDSYIDPVIRWEFNREPVPDNSHFFSIRTRAKSSTLKIRGASLEHAGRYRCNARSSLGFAESDVARLVVEMEPTIVEGPGDHVVTYGTILNLTCQVQAYPPPQIAWFKNLEPLREWTNRPYMVVNITRSANYTCFYRNQVQGEDRLAAKAGEVLVKGLRPSYCARYNGAVCRKQLASTDLMYIFVDGNEQETQFLDQTLETSLVQSVWLNNRSDLCQAGVRELMCHAVHPTCQVGRDRAYSLPICRTDCQAVQNLCVGWSTFVNSFFDEKLAAEIRRHGLASCNNLPDTGCTQLWDDKKTTTVSSTLVHSTGVGAATTIYTTEPTKRLPPSIQDDPTDQEPVQGDPHRLLMLVIGIPAGVVLIIVAVVSVIGIKRYRYLSQFNLPRNIDLSGMKDNPMYGKDFDTSFNPHLSYLEYNRNSVIYEKDIGEGAFGRVFKAIAPKLVEGEAESSVAVKVLKCTADRAVTEYFNREASMIAKFSHQNIIRLLGVCFVGKPLCLLLEYMSEGDLEDFLHSKSPHHCNSRTSSGPGNGLKTYQKLNMARQVACGMVYLNERRFVHRDIATRNCLVNSHMIVKISDFGLARYLGQKDCYIGHKEEHIPIRWTAPEALWNYQFTFASDVWSFGLLLWEIFSYAEQPYTNLSHEDVFLHTRKGYRLACPEDSPVKAHQIMTECWLAEPADRPRFSQVEDSLASLEYEWLANGEETMED